MAYTIRSLYDELDEIFQRHLNESEDSRCLLNLLRFPAADLMPHLVSYFLKFYDTKDNVFDFNGIKLCISLEDVLFLTGLPIDGEAVISSESRDRDGFNRVFQLPNEKAKSNKVLRSIAKNVSLDDDTRKKAVLLLTITCFIVPSSNAGRVTTTYLRYIEDLGRVDSFAWGAALLARLYHAIAECEKGDEGEGQRTVKEIRDGNSWVILSFFILRIPKLREALSLYLKLPINLNVEQLQVPFMPQIVEQLQKMSHNHRADFEAFKGVLDDNFLNISHNDVEWTPYANSDHPQKKFGTRIGPILCNNFVVHHKPHIAPGQFPVFKKYDLASLNWQPPKIEFKKNCGPCEQNFKKHYEKEVDWWNAKKLAEELMKEKTPNDNEEGTQRSPICTPSSTRMCSPTPYDNQEDSPGTAKFELNRNEESNNITDPMRLNVLNSLNPDTFVSADVIILYIRYLKRTVSSERVSKCLLENSYTYTKMEAEFGSGVSQATLAKKLLMGRNCNKYSYMLFPVFKHFHYRLAIVCFLDEEENLGPIVLHMDSLSAHNSDEVFNTIEWFLEILGKNMNGANTTIPRVIRKLVEVPQQPNSHDCAYFVMHMMRLFLEQAPPRFKMEHLQMFHREWFKPEVASALREEMRHVMEKELNDYFTVPLEPHTEPEPHINPTVQKEQSEPEPHINPTVQKEQYEPLQNKA